MTTEFFCPQCNTQVHLKVGDVVIPHFAHEKQAACSASFSEGESREHLEGKRQLYKFFREKVGEVVLEPYFKLLSQRPDLLVTVGSNLIPIEFQCSTISVNRIESRTNGYLNAGMEPIWILHTPAEFNTLPQGVGIFQFSKFQVSFFTYKSPEGTVFRTYDPQSEQFHYFSSLIHMIGNRYVGIHRTLPISMQIFPFARPKKPTEKELDQYLSIYLTIRANFLKSRILLNRRGVNDPFLRSCYDLRVIPVDLPFWIGLPVPFSEAFQENNWEWQMRLLYFMRKNGIFFSNLSEGLIRKFISLREEPTIERMRACLAYRDHLITAGVEPTNKDASFDKEKIVALFAERFLAKSNEN